MSSTPADAAAPDPQSSPESATVVEPDVLVERDEAPQPRRPHRRVTTAPAPGTDPHPVPEPARSTGSENDARLKADKPPHWG